MNTKRQFSSGPVPRHRRACSAMIAAWLYAGLLITYPSGAEEAGQNGATAKSTTAAPPAAPSGPVQMIVSMTPAPSAKPVVPVSTGPLHGPNCTGAIRAENTVIVPLGKSQLVPIDEPVRNRTLGDPAIAQATMVSPQTLYIVGQAVGSTNMIVQGKSGACQIIDVIVNVDASGLQASLAQLLPDEHDIRITTAADNLVLSGRVSSAQAAQEALEIAKVYSASATASASGKTGGVLNMMTVDSPQQVMLEVKVAEVDKTLIDQLGAAVNLQGGFGSWTGALVSNLLAGVSSAVGFSKANKLPLAVQVDAQKTDNLVKILAEPNLVTVSGQEATFLAGGEVFIPVPQSGSSGSYVITLQAQEFGVGLKFTPTVLGNGKINLRVAPEVSELSPTGVTLSSTTAGATSVLPLITTRRASTTVQMADGESFAIGGLISNNVTGALKAVPGLGEIPVLGALLRSTSFQQDRSELVFIITPHLVKPQPLAKYRMPTDSFTQPNEGDVYATGNMEGRSAAHKDNTPPAATAPDGSQMQPPAPAPVVVPAPAPRPATQIPAAPSDSANTPDSQPKVYPVPVSAVSPRALPLPDDPTPVTAQEYAGHITRIEAEAAQIATSDAQKQASPRDAPNAAPPPVTAVARTSEPVGTVEDLAARVARIEAEAASIAARERNLNAEQPHQSDGPETQIAATPLSGAPMYARESQAERAARIEADAARIAANEARQHSVSWRRQDEQIVEQ